MRTSAHILLFILFTASRVNAQTFLLHGQVRDLQQGKECFNSLVSLLRTDSSLIDTIRTGKEGYFSFTKQLAPGNYLLLVTHPSYDVLYKPLDLKSETAFDLGVLPLSPRSDTLASVVVRPHQLLPRVKKDTIEYNTEHMQVHQNAAVDELLGRLPGLRVDINGNITFNGQRIQQLLVDGEDIFGSDPRIISRNLDANKIARVQVIDKKSRQSELTGIDDGGRTKALNLVLKSSERNGYFGKGEAGVEPDAGGIYHAAGVVGSFRGKEQLVLIGLAANNGTSEYNGGSPEAGQLGVSGGGGDPLGASAGQGIPRVVATGLHYANAWNGGQEHTSGNYQYGYSYTQPVTATTTIQNLPDTVYTQQQRLFSDNRWSSHVYDVKFDLMQDSLGGLDLFVSGLSNRGINRFGAMDTSAFNGKTINSDQRTIRSNVSDNAIGAGLYWHTRSGKKPRRDFSLIAALTRIDNNTIGYLYSYNRYFLPDSSLLGTDTVDQRKSFSEKGWNANGTATYVEPLSKTLSLGVSYSLQYNDSRLLQSTYANADGKYGLFVDSLSSNYHSRRLNHVVSLNLQNSGDRFSYTAGLDLNEYTYRQQDLLTDSILHYNYTYLSPKIITNYAIDPYSSLYLNYLGDIKIPDIRQLQPTRNNSDPLHSTLGNPSLRPGFVHAITIGFNRAKKIMLSGNLNMAFATSAISTRTITDSLGRQVSQAVNTAGEKNLGFNLNLIKKIAPLGIDIGVNTGASYTNNFNFLGADLSRNTSYTAIAGLNLEKYVANRYSFQLTGTATYFNLTSSVNRATVVAYWSQQYSGSVSFFPFKGFRLATVGNYNWKGKSGAFSENTQTFIWNAFATQDLLSEGRLSLKAEINNILDQRTGISRTNAGNSNTETYTNILGRYWLISLIYRFSGKWKSK